MTLPTYIAGLLLLSVVVVGLFAGIQRLAGLRGLIAVWALLTLMACWFYGVYRPTQRYSSASVGTIAVVVSSLTVAALVLGFRAERLTTTGRLVRAAAGCIAFAITWVGLAQFWWIY